MGGKGIWEFGTFPQFCYQPETALKCLKFKIYIYSFSFSFYISLKALSVMFMHSFGSTLVFISEIIFFFLYERGE